MRPKRGVFARTHNRVRPPVGVALKAVGGDGRTIYKTVCPLHATTQVDFTHQPLTDIAWLEYTVWRERG